MALANGGVLPDKPRPPQVTTVHHEDGSGRITIRGDVTNKPGQRVRYFAPAYRITPGGRYVVELTYCQAGRNNQGRPNLCGDPATRSR